ncbi:hypothetical protein AGMMS50262_10440 [Bacteroidia bacterium]|nr:hypothetical protein AGMMS50262_10440 [Bacteroidia bacterium]
MAQNVPLVYNSENTGADCAKPVLPAVKDLPSSVRLPNPFEWSDGHGTAGTLTDWECRRNEIKAEIEDYEIGVKPARPADISATYSGGTLTITVKENGKTLILTSKINIPSGTGPFPVIIGMNTPTGNLSASLFDGCIQIPFNHDQVATYSMSGNKDLNAPFYKMYPGLSQAGDYCAWAWGVSRLIDGIELIQSQLKADLAHIGVTGCSYAGKMALFAGAFDERIALTIAQESGGGGIASWRVSETLGSVENINSTNYSWFMPALKNNFGGQVNKLPYDHHELIAMIAPRAFLAFGNDGWTWLADESGYVSCMAAREVWKKFGVEDRFGFDFTGGHNHCQAASSQDAAATKFIDKFLRGKSEVNTANILTSPYQSLNYQFWISEWADVTEPAVPAEQYFYEAESNCVSISGDYVINEDNNASNGKQVTLGSNGWVTVPFTVKNNHEFNFYLRLSCPNDKENSLWVQIDNEAMIAYDGLSTNGQWQWQKTVNTALLAGSHTLTIGYRENSVKLDRIYITNDNTKLPEGMGGTETDCEPPIKYTVLDFENGNIYDWTKQNPGAGIMITQEDKHGGEYALKMINGSGTDAWSVQAFTPPVEIVSGHVYHISFWVRAVDGGGKGRISTNGSGKLGSSQYWNEFTVGNTWQKIEYKNLTAAGSTIQLAFDMGYIANKTYYIDDIVFDDTNVPVSITNVQPEAWATVFSPFHGMINVTAPENSGVRIADIIGRTVGMHYLRYSPLELSVRSGIYVVSVRNANKTYTQKIFVK